MNHIAVGIASILSAGAVAGAGWTWYYLNHCIRHPDLDEALDEAEDERPPMDVPVRWHDKLRVWCQRSLKEDQVPKTKLLIYIGNARSWRGILVPVKDLEGMQERIIGAAIRHPDGLIYGVGYGGRHHHCIRYMGSVGKAGLSMTHDQGFMTTEGRYVDRTEGLWIARAAGQIIRKTNPPTKLFSEDLW